MAEEYPIFSLSGQDIYPTIRIKGLKEILHFSTLTALKRIAEIQGIIGYSNPPINVNCQADCFWTSTGTWNTIESTDCVFSSAYRSLVFRTYLTTDEPINQITLTRTGWQGATIIPWDNKIIFARITYESGGKVRCHYLVYDYSTGQSEEKNLLVEDWSYITSAGYRMIFPTAGKHFAIGYWYRTSAGYYYYFASINYETNTRVRGFALGSGSYDDSVSYVLCEEDGSYVNVIAIDWQDTPRVISCVFQNGNISTSREIAYLSNWTLRAAVLFLLRNGRSCLFLAYNRGTGGTTIDSAVLTASSISNKTAVGVGTLTPPCIIDKDRVMCIWQYYSSYYGTGFNVNNGSYIENFNFGSSPPTGYYIPSNNGFGRADLWSDNLFLGSVAYFGNVWYRCIFSDTSKIIRDLASTLPEGIYVIGKRIYIISYSTTNGLFTAQYQDLSQYYVEMRDTTHLRTKAFNMIKPSNKAITHIEGIGYLSQPIYVRILDENNNIIGQGGFFDEIKLASQVSKAKIEIRGINARYNFAMILNYGVLYE